MAPSVGLTLPVAADATPLTAFFNPGFPFFILLTADNVTGFCSQNFEDKETDGFVFVARDIPL